MSIKLCGTILKDNPEVLEQSLKYGVITHDMGNILPKEFNGFSEWKFITDLFSIQHGAGDWAFASVKAFKFRLDLNAYRQFYIPDLTATEILLMIDQKQYSPSPSFQQKNSLFQGYSIYDAYEYCYLYGFPTKSCFNMDLLKDNGIDIENIKNIEEKTRIIQKNSEKLDRTHCLSKYDGKYSARRIFRVNGLANVGWGKDETLEKDILSIKAEIFKSGPVVGGFLVYEDFINNYDGTTIYEGPPDEKSKIVGGHSVVLFGWGNDPKLGEYWIASNGWGQDWGLMGVFKIKIGIKKCLLEKNIVSCYAEIPNIKILRQYDIGLINPNLSKIREKINPLSFYTKKSEELIRNGTIVGRLGENKIINLISDPKKLLDTDKFFAAYVELYSFLHVDKQITHQENYYILVPLTIVSIFFLTVIIRNLKW